MSKHCSRCRREKTLAEFGAKSRAADGRRPECLECQRRAAAEYRARNAERLAAKRAARPVDREYHRRYRAANRDRLLAMERARKLVRPSIKLPASYYAEWHQKNKERTRPRRLAAVAKRRASLLQATPKWADLKAIEAFYAEAKRLEKLSGIKWHVDHIVPLCGRDACGLHCEANLQVIPACWNAAKSNSLTL